MKKKTLVGKDKEKSMDIDKLANILGKIKDLKRQGWVRREVTNPESVADHSFGVALLALILCPKELDKQKCLEFAIIHDLAEIITGDITPGDKIPADIKYAKEAAAIKQISEELEAPEIEQLFLEFEKQDTPEAKFIKKMDRLDLIATAKYYTDNNRTTFFEEKDIGFDSLYHEFYSNHKEFLASIIEK